MFMQASPAVSGGFSFADLLPQKLFNLKESVTSASRTEN